MSTSIIYRNIFMYRLIMNFLYFFKYKKRFVDIISQLKSDDRVVLELCFGDTYIAEVCKKSNVSWMGFDINEYLVKIAQRKGFDARLSDLSKLDSFPKADVCIMSGSLYHFIDDLDSLILKILNSADKIIISEPIENWSSKKGIIGKISSFLTNAGKGNENFRFNETSFIETFELYAEKYNFTFEKVSKNRDILIVINYDRN